MVSTSKHLILSAVSKRAESVGMFRAREIVADTGLSKQLVNYHLSEWEKRGYIARNPLNPVERLLIDLASLLEELSSSAEYDGARTYHMRDKHTIFNPDYVQELRAAVDMYVALKYLGFNAPKEKDKLEDYIDKAIEELRRERAYMHNKKMAERTAAKYIAKHREDVDKVPDTHTAAVMEKVQEILRKEEQGLRLVSTEAEPKEEVDTTDYVAEEWAKINKQLNDSIALYNSTRKQAETKPEMEKYLSNMSQEVSKWETARLEFLERHPEYNE